MLQIQIGGMSIRGHDVNCKHSAQDGRDAYLCTVCASLPQAVSAVACSALGYNAAQRETRWWASVSVKLTAFLLHTHPSLPSPLDKTDPPHNKARPRPIKQAIAEGPRAEGH